jgi:hypothetical protein
MIVTLLFLLFLLVPLLLFLERFLLFLALVFVVGVQIRIGATGLINILLASSIC